MRNWKLDSVPYDFRVLQGNSTPPASIRADFVASCAKTRQFLDNAQTDLDFKAN
jgi:hypothetical protein